MKNLITEQFLSVQGEGRSVGQQAYFIRFAGCNLRCGWCDTLYSVDPDLYRGKTFEIDYSQVPKNCDLVVLTGGEPTLFDLIEVRGKLSDGYPQRRFEVETNGTHFPGEIADFFSWNISPKLSSSHQQYKEMDLKRLSGLQSWVNYARNRDSVVFKFVLSSPQDRLELLDIVSRYEIPRKQVYVMAQGTTQESQSLNHVNWLIDLCCKEGFHYSPRLHIMLWGDKRGV